MKCLLLTTKDKRNFFTRVRNLPQLVEFSKTFGAEISVVKTKDPPILDLIELAPAICNPNYAEPENEFEILERKIPVKIKSRKNTVKVAEQIRAHVRKALLDGRIVHLHRVAKRFEKQQLSHTTFSNHIRKVRDELILDGYNVIKVKPGQYQIA